MAWASDGNSKFQKLIGNFEEQLLENIIPYSLYNWKGKAPRNISKAIECGVK